MAATVSETSYGRVATFGGNVTAIQVTIGGNGATYAAASGGLPIDLTQAISGGVALGSGAAQFSQPYLNPGDVVGFVPLGPSTNGFLPTGLVVGTATYGPAAYPFNGGSQNAIHPVNQLLTCPATIKLLGSGAAANGAFGQVADGVNNDSFTGLLYIARGGTNA
jgi:hypothetical protein